MLTQTLESLENADFDLFLLRKEYNVCLKSTEELSYMTLKSDAKFEEN